MEHTSACLVWYDNAILMVRNKSSFSKNIVIAIMYLIIVIMVVSS